MRLRRRSRPVELGVPGIPDAASYIEGGCNVSGQLQFRDGVRIDGHVEGELRAEGAVIVGEGACVVGSIFADSVVVLGQVEGEITARCQVTVFKSGRVHGDIHTVGIAVEPGASLRGCIVIGDEAGRALTAGPPTDPPAAIDYAPPEGSDLG
ncbi:MAG: polymer-forming cytoskeletal protein [Myxococcota bacterium]